MPGAKTDNEAVRKMIRDKAPLIMFGSYNERMYVAECGARTSYIPASFPGAIIRRHIGTPFMGYSGATYLIQEVANALFDALFHILPLASQMDKVDATLAKAAKSLPWSDEAKTTLDNMIEDQPILIRISVAKRMRDRAEREARLAGEETVLDDHVINARDALLEGATV